MTATLLSLLLTFASIFYNVRAQETFRLVPALYIFGDSYVDGGNTQLFHPYGMDLNANLPRRWTNGKTYVDFIATFLGLPIVPPSRNMSLAGKSATGVNYGYGGSGILPQTCPGCWGFDVQIANFTSTLTNSLSKLFNQQDLANHLSNSLFIVSFGINDYYFDFLPPGKKKFSDMESTAFAKFLLNELSARLKTLYGLGVRKFLVNGIWPLGCTPEYAGFIKDGPLGNNCNETINDMIRPYNDGLPPILKELQSKLAGAVFTHADDFQLVANLKANPSKYGITNMTRRCFFGFPCTNRGQHLHFDNIHITQAANQIFALNCFNGTLCSPYNIKLLLGIK